MTTKIPVELVADQVFGGRRLNINGDMRVAQRGTVTGATSSYGGPDRIRLLTNALGAYTLSQSDTSPNNFAQSYNLTTTTANTSPASAAYALLQYRFEGYDLQSLKWGTADAEQITVSFWVYTNKTGTYNLELYQLDNSSYPSANKQYTVSASNTWEKKIVTFPSGNNVAIPDDNTNALNLNFWLGGGSDYTSGSAGDGNFHNTAANRAAGNVNLADSTSNAFKITGLQIETGTQATPFEYRSLTDEINLCQRYYEQSCGIEKDMKTTTDYYASATAEKYNYQGFIAYTNGLGYVPATSYRIQKRITPSVSLHTGTGLVSGSPSANQVLVYRAGTWAYGAGSYTGWASSEASLSFHVTYPSISASNETTSQLTIYGWVADAEL